jgi:hypothetical protein
MKLIKATALASSIMLGALFFARSFAAEPAESPKPETATTGVHSIELPKIDQAMPPGRGSENLATACIICHSNRYITMQPPLTRAAWTALVDKMRKTFGAPVTDAQAPEIVNYLMSIRGKDEPAAKP